MYCKVSTVRRHAGVAKTGATLHPMGPCYIPSGHAIAHSRWGGVVPQVPSCKIQCKSSRLTSGNTPNLLLILTLRFPWRSPWRSSLYLPLFRPCCSFLAVQKLHVPGLSHGGAWRPLVPCRHQVMEKPWRRGACRHQVFFRRARRRAPKKGGGRFYKRV